MTTVANERNTSMFNRDALTFEHAMPPGRDARDELTAVGFDYSVSAHALAVPILTLTIRYLEKDRDVLMKILNG